MKDLVIRTTPTLFPSEAEWAMLKEQAAMVVKTGFLPRAVDTPERAIAIALKGRELGIPPMQAFAHIHIVDGKPTISAELMLSLIYKNSAGAIVNYIEDTDKRCVVEAKRQGGKATKFSFTIDEARQAGLLAKNNWKSYPAAMLRARTVAIVARALFPDAIAGCSHIPDELGADIDEDGNIALPASQDGAAAPEGKAAKPDPKKRTRKDLGIEIMNAAKDLDMDKEKVEEWAQEDFNKSAKDLTVAEMEALLGTLLMELGRKKGPNS